MIKEIIDFSWTLFLDRDGVINKRDFGGYIQNLNDFHFNSDVFEFLEFAHLHFHRIVVVTNQQGVGKGIMSYEDLDKIHNYMITEVVTKNGRIDKVYSATNLKTDQNNIRKPLPFMAYQAKHDFSTIDFSKSIMIGDTDSDILFGKRLGMKTILIESEEVTNESPDFRINSLKQLIF